VVGGLDSWSSYGIVLSRSKIATFFEGGTTNRKWLTNNRYRTFTEVKIRVVPVS